MSIQKEPAKAARPADLNERAVPLEMQPVDALLRGAR